MQPWYVRLWNWQAPAPKYQAAIGSGGNVSTGGGLYSTAMLRQALRVNSDSIRKLPVFRECVRVVSAALRAMEFRVLDRETGEDVPDHPLIELLRNPSESETGAVFWDRMFWELEMSGNAFAAYDASNRLVLAEHVNLTRKGARWEYELHLPGDIGPGLQSTTTFKSGPDSVLHLRGPDYDPFTGLSRSPQAAAERVLKLAQAADRNRLGAALNGGKNPITLKPPPEAPESEVVKYAELMKGKRDENGWETGGLLTLPPGWDANVLGFHQMDPQSIALNELIATEVARIQGVPMFLLKSNIGGSGGASGNLAGGTGVQAQWAGFVRTKLRPVATMIQAEIEAKLLSPADRQNYRVLMDSAALELGTPQEVAMMADLLVQKAGLMTVNEGRALLHLEPVEDGDMLREPTGAPAQDPGGPGREDEQEDVDDPATEEDDEE